MRTRSRYLELGNSLSAFMSEVGVAPHGVAHGPLARFQNQLARLLATTFRFYKIQRGETLHYTRGKGFVITDDSELWWEPRRPSSSSGQLGDAEVPAARRPRPGPWNARLVLSERFFEEILEHRIPVNLRALGALQAPLAMDLYVWLTYRLHALSRPVTVPWKALHLQCGSQTSRVPVFRLQVLKKLPSILTVYPEAQVQAAEDRPGWSSGPVRRTSPICATSCRQRHAVTQAGNAGFPRGHSAMTAGRRVRRRGRCWTEPRGQSWGSRAPRWNNPAVSS